MYERFNLVELIQGIIQSLAIMVEQSEIQLRFVHDKDVYVWADELKTEQVVRNYLTNAIHYALNEKVVEVRIAEVEHGVRVSVFNTGNPIPEEDIEHLWDKFYKVDKARTREYGGNGIGLSIVKAIMNSFHKDFGVKNYDNGVQFWFELDTR
jgi:signal transduction histidine kinase